MIKFFRSQEELLERIVARMDQATEPAVMLEEVSEYMKQASFIPLALRELYQDVSEDTETEHQDKRECTCLNLWLHPEDNHVITQMAYRSLSRLESAARHSQGPHFARIAAQFRAWKWLMGHANADILFDRMFDHRRASPHAHQLVEWLTRELMHDHWTQQAGNDYAKRKNQSAIRERMRNEAIERSTKPQAANRKAVAANRDRRVPRTTGPASHL